MPKPRSSLIAVALGAIASVNLATTTSFAQEPPPQQQPPQQQPPPGYPPQPAQAPVYPQQPAPTPQQPAPPPVYPQQPAPPPQGYPQQPQQPPQGYPQQPPQGYPQQQQPAPYPQQPQPSQGYPQQQPPPGYPPQQPGYPPQGYPQQQPPPGYPPQQPGYPPQGYPQQQPPPGYQPPPPPPASPYPYVRPPRGSDYRTPGEMVALYGTSLAYGVGSGIWIDSLGHTSDPGIAFIAPLAIGAGVPVGLYFLDRYSQFHRGVPSSIATGLSLGAVEGIAVAATQWQLSGHNGPNTWSFATDATLTWTVSTLGGMGGYAFGEWLRPDPRALGFISGGAGWGAIAGTLLGAGISTGDGASGAAVGGLVGYNVGILATGALSLYYVPSWRSQKYMWAGFVGGTAAASVVYIFYLFSNADPRHGLIANAVGGLAGLGLASALTANMTDDDATMNAVRTGVWTPPFQIGVTPVTNPGTTQRTGTAITASGKF